MFNIRAWLMWLAAALAVALLATNPLYLIIVLLCAALIRTAYGTSGSPLPVWRFGITVVAFSTFYNALLVHFGGTVLFTLPRVLPLVGGPVTLEAAAFGAVRGLALWALFAVSSVFNDVLSPYELVRLTPRFLRQAGMVVSIMLAFVPQTIRSFRQVREAQAIRGHRLRGVRDLPALFVPLLTDALEKAVQLAEAMEARGYGQTLSNPPTTLPAHTSDPQSPIPNPLIPNLRPPTSSAAPQTIMTAGLATLLAGWLVEAYGHTGIGWILMGLGVVAVLFGARQAARRTSRVTRYRPQSWSARDSLLVAMSLVPFALMVATALFDPAALVFYPYPKLMPPSFDVRLGLSLALLGAPAFVAPRARHSPAQTSVAGK
jgi:energy-coupling factor transport system permease protein